MDNLRTLYARLTEFWKRQSLGRRFALLAGGVVLLAALVGVWYWATQPDYRVLYGGLTEEDAAAIVEKLQAQAAPYRLAAGGTTILVPAEQVQQRRIELVRDGLPARGGKGLDFFEHPPLGMTPFTQHVNYLRALQAELAKTITQIDPVVSARVHIVRPDPTPFIREQKPTTASVVLKLRPGTTLTRNVSAAIVALVSRGVEGLAPENVTLLDTNGRLLSEPYTGDRAAMNSQMEYRRELEGYLAAKAEGMLAQVLGQGRAVVRVTADINFQRSREKKETYNPEGRVVQTETISSSKSAAAGGGSRGGPAGTTSNLGKQPAPGGASTSGTSSQEETIQTTFALSRVTQELEENTGGVERLTVAAMVDLSGDGAAGFTLARAQEIVKKAVGFKSGRDEIEVSEAKLAAPVPATDEEWERVQWWQNVLGLVRHGSLGLAALVALLLGWLVLRRFRQPAPASPPAPAVTVVRQRLTALAEQDPALLARLLVNWLQQSERQRRVTA